MIAGEIATGLVVAMTAGLTAVALHETAETVRAFAPNNGKKKTSKPVIRDKKYQSLIFGDD